MNKEQLSTSYRKYTKLYHLGRCLRIFIFFTFIILTLILNADNGVTSWASQHIKNDLSFSDDDYELFVNVPTIGRIIGSLIFCFLLNHVDRKSLMISVLCIHSVLFFGVYLYNDKYVLLIIRGCIGFLKVFTHIYIPIWVDQFAMKSVQTILMTIIILTAPLGRAVGFGIGSCLAIENWRSAFMLIGCGVLIIILVLIGVPYQYFSIEFKFSGYDESVELDDDISLFRQSIAKSNDKESKGNKDSFIGMVSKLLFNGSYILSVYARANLLFIYQVIHSFIGDYVINALKSKQQKQILYYYSISSVIGPIMGCLCGGISTSKVGGYEHMSSIYICMFFSFVTIASVFPLVYSFDYFWFSLSLFLFFFSSSALLPTILGYIISSVTFEQKAIASSLNLFITTVLGNVPGPIVYSFINKSMKSKLPMFAWKCTMFYFFFGFGAVLMACVFRYKEFNHEIEMIQKRKKKEKIEESKLSVMGFSLDESMRPKLTGAYFQEEELQEIGEDM